MANIRVKITITGFRWLQWRGLERLRTFSSEKILHCPKQIPQRRKHLCGYIESLSLLSQRMCACVNSFWHVALWTGTHEPAHIRKRRPLAKVWFACAEWHTRDCPFSLLRHYLVSNVMLPPPPLCWGLNTGAHGCWVCVLPPHNSISPVLSLQACPCCMVWLWTSFQIRPCCPLLTHIFLTMCVWKGEFFFSN